MVTFCRWYYILCYIMQFFLSLLQCWMLYYYYYYYTGAVVLVTAVQLRYYIITHQFIPRANEVTVNWEVSLKLVYVYCLVVHFEINQDQLMLCGMWR